MIPHEIINASAGTGKTWQLTVRWIAILAAGNPPESIAALTFSRAAAGEFFARIIGRLAAAAADEGLCRKLAADTGAAGLDCGRCLVLLRQVIDAMPSLLLGTLDSFFVRIVRAFPFELGLSGEFAILDEQRQKVERLRVCEGVFAAEVSAEVAAEQEEFLRAFDEATYGREDAGILKNLDGFIDEWHRYYLEARAPEVWGDAGRIWRGRAPELPEGGWDAVLARAEAVAEGLGGPDRQRKAWEKLFEGLREWVPGSASLPKLNTLWENLLGAVGDLRAGRAEVKNYQMVEVAGETAAGLAALVDYVCLSLIRTRLRQTRGVYGVIGLYDRNYDERVRRRGQLTFQDVLGVLSGEIGTGGEGGGGLEFAGRQLIDYRLDGKFRHWLLDEFQDTSRAQWRVLENLCDEAIQDTEGERTFFAVGDPKQSIHVWRGAAPELLEEILDRYNGPRDEVTGVRRGDHVHERPLNVSRRSCPAVIGMVNALLGERAGLGRYEVLETAVRRWRFPEHEAADAGLEGGAVVLEIPAVEEGEDGEGEDAVWRACGELLVEMQVLRRGLSCAVICNRNGRALELADYLRRVTGMEVIADADAEIGRDNPVCGALLDLIGAAAHPADEFAWQHVLMTPLRQVMEDRYEVDGVGERERGSQLKPMVMRAVLQSVLHHGFAATLREWVGGLEIYWVADAFSRARVRELLRCAAAFDETGSRDADDFLTFAETWKERETAAGGVIRVMNAHKCKGLTFDVVVLADLHDGKMFQSRVDKGFRYEDGRLEWLTMLPARAVSETDPVLREALGEMGARTWLERLAQLYVMVTRARWCNVVLLPARKAKAKPGTGALGFARLVREVLGSEGLEDYVAGGFRAACVARWGRDDWYLGHALGAERTRAASGGEQVDLSAGMKDGTKDGVRAGRVRRPVLVRRTATGGGEAVFDGRRHAAMAAGNVVHALLSGLEWVGGEGDAAWRARLEAAGAGVAAMVGRCLEEPGVRALLERPEGRFTLWREQAFDYVAGGELVSGVFDRVVLHHGEDGVVERVQLIDFKTDAVADAGEAAERLPERHGEQMGVYREALSRLTGVPAEEVETWLIAVAVPAAVKCPH